MLKKREESKKIANVTFTKTLLKLPATGFVFTCFNNNYKIIPEIYDSWMRILLAVPNSVLFLYSSNVHAQENLIKEAQKRGVSKSRLVFGGALKRSEYLARLKVADLFLDTFPYNAGTTASDALWVGLPVLTRKGNTFPSRVAASLLNSIGLPELITSTQLQFEEKAIELALSPEKIGEIKEKLIRNKQTHPLFDTISFAKNLESAYLRMIEDYDKNL